MKLSHAQELVLIQTLERSEAHAASERPPEWQKLQRAEWDEVDECGPVYSHTGWFGKLTAGERMRLYRAVRALEDHELVEPTRFIAAHCRPVLHLKLTPEGARLAKQLRDDQPHNT